MHSIWSFSLFFQKWNHTAHIILLLSFLTWNIMAISCGKRCRSNLLFWMHCAVFNHIQLFATPWTVVRQAPLSMEFSRQEYWSGLPWLPSGIFPTQGSNPGLPHCRRILYQLSYQGSLTCCHPWGFEESNTTWRLNSNQQGSALSCISLWAHWQTKTLTPHLASRTIIVPASQE